MTSGEGTAARPQRRAGTFTLGVVLVAAGCGMMASLFWPSLDLSWMLKASPVILVALGAEVLLANYPDPAGPLRPYETRILCKKTLLA